MTTAQLAVCLGLLLPGSLAEADDFNFFGLAKYVDPLPVMPRLKVEGPCPCELTVRANEFTTTIHRDLAPVTTWGYEGSTPGPLIEVERDQELTVHWVNNLPVTHMFPVPTGVMTMSPDVRMVTHLHGASVPEPEPMNLELNSDGWPDAFFAPGGQQRAIYPNHQSARMLWYHDHAMGTTGRNVAAGMAGVYLIRDTVEKSLNLPSGDFEMPLIFQSRQISGNGKLGYTRDIGMEFFGNVVTVNGKAWPYVEVEPRKYRVRFLNGTNARTVALSLIDSTTHAPGPTFYQIGSDGGFLPEVAVLNDAGTANSPALTLAPAERADVIIDFAKAAGQSLVLANTALPSGDHEFPISELMLFKVKLVTSGPDTSQLPTFLPPIEHLDPKEASVTRQIVFDRMTMPDGEPMLTLNGKAWADPATEKPLLGATEIWDLVNPLTDAHPFHIHLVNFQILGRKPVNSTAELQPPPPNERGWKDTVIASPGMVTRVIMRFGPYAGSYVYHCHILEHEDMDMMRPFIVVNPLLEKQTHEAQ